MSTYLLFIVSFFIASCEFNGEYDPKNNFATSRHYKKLYDDALLGKYDLYPQYDSSADNYYPLKSSTPPPPTRYENKYPSYDPDADNPPEQVIPKNRAFDKPMFK